jgi:hypothetical protein
MGCKATLADQPSATSDVKEMEFQQNFSPERKYRQEALC